MKISREEITQKYKEYQIFIEESCNKVREAYFDKYEKCIHDNNPVIDENMSVKWNREEVQRLKDEYKELVNTEDKLRKTKRIEIENMVQAYIQQNYPKITDAKYIQMMNFLLEWDEYAYYMSNGADYTITCLIDLANLICS